MVCRRYISKNLRAHSLNRIEQVNWIVDDYLRQGYKLTLRQIFYQLVSRDLIENTVKSYKTLGDIVNDGRMLGLIDWDAIEDRTRQSHNAYGHTEVHEHNVEIDDIRTAVLREIEGYYLHPWTNQPYYLEVWVEKSALEGIVRTAAEKYRAPYLATRGYPSVTLVKDAADRFIEHTEHGQLCVILHLGDHDPSGVDMTRDIGDRLATLGAGVDVQRIALNMPQIKKYNPPPNPAKETDSRCSSYMRRYGGFSWELDALRPEVLSELIQSKIAKYFNRETYQALQTHREEGIEAMRKKYSPLLKQLDKIA